MVTILVMVPIIRDGDPHRDGDHPRDFGHLKNFYHPTEWLLS